MKLFDGRTIKNGESIMRRQAMSRAHNYNIGCEGCEGEYEALFATDDGVNLCAYCYVSLLKDDLYASEKREAESRELLKEIWDSVPSVYEPYDHPEIIRHTKALTRIPKALKETEEAGDE